MYLCPNEYSDKILHNYCFTELKSVRLFEELCIHEHFVKKCLNMKVYHSKFIRIDLICLELLSQPFAA